MQQKLLIEIGFMKRQVKKLVEKLIGQVFRLKKCSHYQKECLMQLEFQIIQEGIIIVNLTSIFMD